MDALEFSGRIEHGVIRIPKKYEGYENAVVRVIVLIEQQPQPMLSKKEQLRLAFKKMESIQMFSQISDPVAWQKKLRDEWD